MNFLQHRLRFNLCRMADPKSKYADNVPGKWYVDASCIICGLCSEYAPQTFIASEDGDHNRVFQQPVTEEQIKMALDAKESCPTDAIGNDGEPPLDAEEAPR